MTPKQSKETVKAIQISPRPVRETPIPPPQPRMSRIRADVNVAIAEEDLNMEEAKQQDEDAEHEVISFDEGANLARYGIVVTPPQKWDNMSGTAPEPGCWRCCVCRFHRTPRAHMYCNGPYCNWHRRCLECNPPPSYLQPHQGSQPAPPSPSIFSLQPLPFPLQGLPMPSLTMSAPQTAAGGTPSSETLSANTVSEPLSQQPQQQQQDK